MQLLLTLLGATFHAFKLLIPHSCRVYGLLPNLEPVSKVLLQILHPSLAVGPRQMGKASLSDMVEAEALLKLC